MRTSTGLFLLSAVVVLAGCSPGSPSRPSPSVSPTAGPTAATATTATTATSTPSPTPPAEPQTPADLLAYIQAGSPVNLATYADGGGSIASFSTPSGNISCGVFGPSISAVLCFVDQNSWPSVPAQTCSDFGDWTDHSLTTSSNGVRRGDCFSEQPFPRPGNVLPYGSKISNGYVACRSESVFLACVHLASGNGFVIAKAIFHTFGTVQPPHGN